MPPPVVSLSQISEHFTHPLATYGSIALLDKRKRNFVPKVAVRPPVQPNRPPSSRQTTVAPPELVANTSLDAGSVFETAQVRCECIPTAQPNNADPLQVSGRSLASRIAASPTSDGERYDPESPSYPHSWSYYPSTSVYDFNRDTANRASPTSITY